MSCLNIVDNCGDKPQKENVNAVKLETDYMMNTMESNNYYNAGLVEHQRSRTDSRRQVSEENKDLSTGQSGTTVVDQGQSPMDEAGLSSSSAICPAPLCRQFWKAGDYEDELGSKAALQSGKNYMHVHPKFLHSNATSHRWIFGGIAELVDNTIDEIPNGATFVIVDKLTNPRAGGVALLFRDDGGGMNPEAIRHCMSFGFSDKKSKSSIGQYGNGFKTSSMRLGADVIVFTRCLYNRTMTQSIGLLSYTFLSQTGNDRIIVPLVDYEFNNSTCTLEPARQFGREHFKSNLSLLLQWSPYSTEVELMKQFDDIGYHGTKVIVYNLWQNNEGNMELDFDSDPQDILIAGETKMGVGRWKTEHDKHIANRFHHSLRAYLSILYLRIPLNFNIVLCGRVVEHHNIAKDLKFPEFIVYKPQSSGCVEGKVTTTIGFLKEAPLLNISGFNLYHKNRLIMPFWQVLRSRDSRGRGVVGVLEADFIEPTHNKQEFEKTSLFQKLEARLRDMTLEYWDHHCELIGYQPTKKARVSEPMLTVHATKKSRVSEPILTVQQPRVPEVLLAVHHPDLPTSIQKPVMLNFRSPAASMEAGFLVGSSQHSEATSFHGTVGVTERSKSDIGNNTQHVQMVRTQLDEFMKLQGANIQTVVVSSGNNNSHNLQPLKNAASQANDQEVIKVMQANEKLRAECMEFEKEEQELNLKVARLSNELEHVQQEHGQLWAELQYLNAMKVEKG